MIDASAQYVFKCLRLIERLSAFAPGRGYGAGRKSQEVRSVLRLMKAAPRLAVDIGGSTGDNSAALRKNNPQLEIHVFVEGHEFATLSGFGRALPATRVLQFEFGGCNIDSRTYFQDFWYFFKNHGFSLLRITPPCFATIDRYCESDEFFATTNYVAVNRAGI